MLLIRAYLLSAKWSQFLEPPPPETESTEEQIIRTLISGSSNRPSLCHTGPGDDAAVLSDGLTITTDSLIEGVHWDDALDAQDVGWKSTCVSVSDLAAMGVQPQWLTCSISLPKNPNLIWAKEFAAGLHKACAFYDIELIGGDTTRSPGPIFINITMGGVADCPVVTRSGARAGDHLWVSGCPGLAAAGYYFDDPFPDALAALRHPTPPLHFARALAHRNCISAMMDLSDGLSADLPRLCHASGVGARVERDRLPHHPELSNADSTYALRLSGGDDFQLLFTAAPEQRADVLTLAVDHNVTVTQIGHMTKSTKVCVDHGEWPPPPWTHFAVQGPAS